MVLAIVLPIALVAAWALRRSGRNDEVDLSPGDEVFAIDPRAITEVRYTTKETSVVAKRIERPADAFGIEVHTADRPNEQRCRSGKTFERLLNELSSVRVKATLAPKDKEGVRRERADLAAKLELRDNTTIDPKEFRVVMLGAPARPVFIDGPLTYEPSVSSDLFARLSGGCTSLSE